MDTETTFDTPPILFLIFNRPDTTKIVFEEIRKARPRQLFIAADGPRPNKPGELEKSEETRKTALQVDWPCEVHTLFRNENLGCGRGVSGAITWFFQYVEEGIILEDDTLPGPGFFRFCSELLEKYREDTRVMAISGSCLPSRLSTRSKHSYFFSNWDYIWGWATWRRAWKYYDYEMTNYEKMVNHGYFGRNYYSKDEMYFMQHSYDLSYYRNKEVTWWSYQWGYARKINSGLVAVPVRNLIVNIGLGSGATNTKTDRWSSIFKFEEMKFPLKHPEFVMVDRFTDNQIFRRFFTSPFSRVKSRIKAALPQSALRKIKGLK